MARIDYVTRDMHIAYTQFRRNASAYNYVTLQHAMLDYQNVTKNQDAPPQTERRATNATPRQTIIERTSAWLAVYSQYAPFSDVQRSINEAVDGDTILTQYYRDLAESQRATLWRAIQRATDARRTRGVYATALDNAR